jgi:hypothetical protein
LLSKWTRTKKAESFQINEEDLKRPSQFLQLGDIIPKTNLRIEKFVFKEVDDPKRARK